MSVLDEKRLCIIPARGGSKRIPRKNIRPFFGKPVIAYAIETALHSQLFSKVFVSTDDPEIAMIAETFGADVDFLRSSKSSSDTATTLEVLKEVIQEFESKGGGFDEVLCLYPVTPLVTIDHLVLGHRLLQQSFKSVVFPVMEFGHPIWRALEMVGAKGKRIWPEHTSSRTQDLKKTYHDTGQWYWFRTMDLKDKESFNELDASPYIMPEILVQDVDNESDWKMLEMKYQLLTNP
jgi:N-acylneuraminate cytidylyltransferase